MKHASSMSTERRVLVAAGHADIVARAAYLLARDGCRLETAFKGIDALEMLQRRHFDLLVLGSAFPDIEGLEVLRRALAIPGVRNVRGQPKAILATLVLVAPHFRKDVSNESVELEAAQRIAALAGGADDALTFPFDDQELRLRAAALLRLRVPRVEVTEDETVIFGPIRVDIAAVEVTINGCRTPLTRAEYRLLCALIRRPGAWLTRTELARALWGSEAPSRRALIAHVSRLRGKLSADGIDIDSRPGKGYCLLVRPSRDQTADRPHCVPLSGSRPVAMPEGRSEVPPSSFSRLNQE